VDQKNVLILGARAPIALELCRQLAKAGCRVVLADSLRYPVARWSRFAQRFVLLPPPAQAYEAYVLALQNLIKDEAITDCIPTCEEVFYVSRCKDELAAKIWTDRFDLMDQLHHKHRFLALATGFFAIPKTVSCRDFLDWENAADYVFKPVYSRFGHQVIIGQKKEACVLPQKNPQDWIAQERIHGQEICIYSIWDGGVLKGFASYVPRHRVGKGAGIFFEPVFEPSVFQAVLDFGQHLHFTGQLSFDVIMKEGQPYVLECNPRGTSGVHLLAADLPLCFFEQKEAIIANPSRPIALKSAWALTNPLALLTKDFYRAKDPIFDPQDIAPFLFQGWSIAELLYWAWKRKTNLLETSTFDIAYDGKNN
jgi:hypothetical protein